ncbi:MAG TPA: ABC transporter permease [Trebonia sp.]|nr:ABC transporter permease [Trebonia sp.]
MFVIFTVALPGRFLTYNNLIGVIGNQAIAAIIALGLIMPLAGGVFDLSVSGVMTLSVVAVTDLFQATHGNFPIPLAIVCVCAGALLVGCFNAFLVLKMTVDPFIATIGTSSVLIGLSQLIGNGTTITNNIPDGFTSFGRASFLQVPISVYVFIGLALLAAYILIYTPFGPTLYATGAARESARLAGIRTNRVLVIAFCASALGAAIAGILFAAQSGSGPPNVGDSYLLGAYASAYLGATIIRPGRFNVAGLIVAVMIIAIGVNGLELSGLPFWVTETFQGVALLVAVVMSRIYRRKTQ